MSSMTPNESNNTVSSAPRQRPVHLNVNTKAATNTNKAPSLSSASSCSSVDSAPSTPLALSSPAVVGNGKVLPTFLQPSPPTFAVSPPQSLVLSDFHDEKGAIAKNDVLGGLHASGIQPQRAADTPPSSRLDDADWLLVHASPTSIHTTPAVVPSDAKIGYHDGPTTPRRMLFEKKEADQRMVDWECGSNYSLETSGIEFDGQKVVQVKPKGEQLQAVVTEISKEPLKSEKIIVEEEKDEPQFLGPVGNFVLREANKYTRKPKLLGKGAWSQVFLGVLEPFSDSGLPNAPIAVAVKQPLNDFSKRTLRNEAKILSSIRRSTSNSKAASNIVQFYGFEESSHTILLNYLPGPRLDGFIAEKASENERNPSNLTLRLPVVGTRQWIFLTEKLVQAFQYLKDNRIVHGDIKPHNIILREYKPLNSEDWCASANDEERRNKLWEPVVTDFSSSFIVDENGLIADDEEPISAVTTTYCAPELLEAFRTPPTTPTRPPSSAATTPLKPSEGMHSKHLSPMSASHGSLEPRPIPTFASDLYSIGVTLLQTAIGSHPYSAANNEMQKTMWVRQGDPLAFARNDMRSFKCMRGGIVDRTIKGCFGKTSERRTTLETVGERVNGMGAEWRTQMEQGNDSWVWSQ